MIRTLILTVYTDISNTGRVEDPISDCNLRYTDHGGPQHVTCLKC